MHNALAISDINGQFRPRPFFITVSAITCYDVARPKTDAEIHPLKALCGKTPTKLVCRSRLVYVCGCVDRMKPATSRPPRKRQGNLLLRGFHNGETHKIGEGRLEEGRQIVDAKN
jgi:hypothetical protein